MRVPGVRPTTGPGASVGAGRDARPYPGAVPAPPFGSNVHDFHATAPVGALHQQLHMHRPVFHGHSSSAPSAIEQAAAEARAGVGAVQLPAAPGHAVSNAHAYGAGQGAAAGSGYGYYGDASSGSSSGSSASNGYVPGQHQHQHQPLQRQAGAGAGHAAVGTVNVPAAIPAHGAGAGAAAGAGAGGARINNRAGARVNANVNGNGGAAAAEAAQGGAAAAAMAAQAGVGGAGGAPAAPVPAPAAPAPAPAAPRDARGAGLLQRPLRTVFAALLLAVVCAGLVSVWRWAQAEMAEGQMRRLKQTAHGVLAVQRGHLLCGEYEAAAALWSRGTVAQVQAKAAAAAQARADRASAAAGAGSGSVAQTTVTSGGVTAGGDFSFEFDSNESAAAAAASAGAGADAAGAAAFPSGVSFTILPVEYGSSPSSSASASDAASAAAAPTSMTIVIEPSQLPAGLTLEELSEAVSAVDAWPAEEVMRASLKAAATPGALVTAAPAGAVVNAEAAAEDAVRKQALQVQLHQLLAPPGEPSHRGVVQLYDGRYAVPDSAAVRSLRCQARQAAAGAAAGVRDFLLSLLSLALQLAIDNPAVTALLLATAGVAGAYHVRERTRAITSAIADAMVESVHEAGAVAFPAAQLEGKVVGDLSARLVASAARLRELLVAARQEVLASGRLQLQTDQAGNEYWVLPQLAPAAAAGFGGVRAPAAVPVPLPDHGGGGHGGGGHAPAGAGAGAAAGPRAGPALPQASRRFDATPVATPAHVAGTPAAYAGTAPAGPGLLYGTPPAFNPQAVAGVAGMPASGGARAVAAGTAANAPLPFYGRPLAMAAVPVPAQPFPVFGAAPQMVQPTAPPATMPGYYGW